MVTQSIPLVADLRNQNRNIGTIYLATGLVTEGDTGGGIYFWNPSLTNPDDGFYYLQVTGVATGRWTRIYAGSNIYNTDGSLLDNRDVTLNNYYLKFIGSSANSTFNADGSVTLSSLSGVNTRMVVANNAGTLSAQSFVPGTTVRFVEKYTATLGQIIFNTTNTLYSDLFDVFLNGVKLNTDSFSFTANQITLFDSCFADDVIDVVGFSSATVYASLPPQAGNAGKYLSTNGTNLSWESISLTGYVPYTGATANVDLGEYELKAGQLSLDVSPTGVASVGTTRWNNTIGISETTLKGGSVILKNGVDLVARIVNKVTPNATLTKAAYQAVRVSGAQGQRLAVAYAQANNDASSADTIGIVTETIPTNQEGFIMTVGSLENINTTGSLQGETWADGDVLYLSPTVPGAITNIKPTGATGHIVVMGYVEYAHINNGKIYVKIMNGWELDELHNVYITSPNNNDALIYESATSLWKNKTIATALGYTPVPTTRTLTINGTAYDLSADRSWTVSSANIYTADGTFTADRTITSNGNSLTILGGKELVAGDQTALQLKTSTTGKQLSLYLINTHTTTGKTYQISSETDGTFRIRDTTQTAFLRNSIGQIAIGNVAPAGSASITLNSYTNSLGILKITGALGVIDGNGLELFFTGNTSYAYSFDRSGNIWRNLEFGALSTTFRSNGSTSMTLTSAGRLLLGTTTESTYILEVNGTPRFSNGTTAGAVFGAGTTVNLASDAYMFATSTTGKNAGYTANRFSTSEYASFDLITGASYIAGWSIQMRPSQTRLDIVDRYGSENVRMSFFSGGNVAIGTTTDAGFKLDVNGTARVSEDFQIGATGIWQTIIKKRTSLANPLLTADFGVSNQMQLTFDGGGFLNMTGVVGFTSPVLYAATRIETEGNFVLRGNNKSLYWVNVTDQYIMGMSGQNLVIRANTGSLTSGGALVSTSFVNGNISFGGSTDVASAQLQIDSTTKGFLPPRMTTTQRDAIASPATGLQVYNTTTNENNTYNGSAWVAAGGATPAGSNTQIQYNNSGAFGASAGLTYNDSTGIITLNKNQNSNTELSIINANTGASSQSVLRLTNGTDIFAITKLSSANGGLGWVTGNSAWLYSGQGNLDLTTDLNSKRIRFGTLNNAGSPQMSLTGSGRLLLGTTTESTFLLDVNGTARVSGGMAFSGGTYVAGSIYYSSSLGIVIAGNTGSGSDLTLTDRNGSERIKIITGGFVTLTGTSINGVEIGTGSISSNITNSSQYGLQIWGRTSSTSNYAIQMYADGGSNGVFIGNNGNLVIGALSTTNVSTAILQANSTTKGFLPPRMTSTQRTAISSPAVGLIVYQTDSTEGTYEYTSTGWRIINAAGGGGVTTVSVASANGFAGTVANATTTPAITISTTVTGLLKGNGTAISAATAGTDYLTPSDVAYSVANVSTTHTETATKGTKIIKADTTGGAFTINLPTAVSNTAIIIIKKVAGSGALTIDGNSTETIDGGTTATINKVYESITLISDNSNWQIV